MFTSPISFLDE
jgi:hypothetical protein